MLKIYLKIALYFLFFFLISLVVMPLVVRNQHMVIFMTYFGVVETTVGWFAIVVFICGGSVGLFFGFTVIFSQWLQIKILRRQLAKIGTSIDYQLPD